jgi:hypothetical protein
MSHAPQMRITLWRLELPPWLRLDRHCERWPAGYRSLAFAALFLTTMLSLLIQSLLLLLLLTIVRLQAAARDWLQCLRVCAQRQH